MSVSTDSLDLDITNEEDLLNLHQGHLDALQKCRDFASSNFQLTKNLQTEVAKLKEQSKEQRGAHTSEKKGWEEERRVLEEARVAEVEGLKRVYAAEARAASAKHSEEKTHSFHNGFTAGTIARTKQDNELIASLENNLADAQKQVAELQAGLTEAVSYRQKCLALEQEVNRLNEEVNVQRSSGSKSAATGNGSGDTPPEDHDAAKLLYDRIAMLEQDLHLERAARAKEREVQHRRLTYETARHIYYKKAYNEFQQGLGSSQGKPDPVVEEARGDHEATLEGPGDGTNRTRASKFTRMPKPLESQSGASEEAQVASVGKVVDKCGEVGPVHAGDHTLCSVCQQPGSPGGLSLLCCNECDDLFHPGCGETIREAADAVGKWVCPPCSRNDENTKARTAAGKAEAGTNADKALAKTTTSIQSFSGLPVREKASYGTADPHASSSAHPGCEPGEPSGDVHTGAVGRSVLREIFSETLFHPSSQENAHSDEQLVLQTEDSGHIGGLDKSSATENGHPPPKPSAKECTSESRVPQGTVQMPPLHQPLEACFPDLSFLMPCVSLTPKALPRTAAPDGVAPVSHIPQGMAKPEQPSSPGGGHAGPSAPPPLLPAVSNPGDHRTCSCQDEDAEETEAVTQPEGPSRDTGAIGDGEHALDLRDGGEGNADRVPARCTGLNGAGVEALKGGERQSRHGPAAPQAPAGGARLNKAGEDAQNQQGGDRQGRRGSAAPQPPQRLDARTASPEFYQGSGPLSPLRSDSGIARQEICTGSAPSSPLRSDSGIARQEIDTGSGPLSPLRSDSGIARQEPCNGHSPGDSETPTSHLTGRKVRPRTSQPARTPSCSPGRRSKAATGLQRKRPSPGVLDEDGPDKLPVKLRRCDLGVAEHRVASYRLPKKGGNKAASGQQRKRPSPDVLDERGPGKLPIKLRRCDLGDAEHPVASHRLPNSKGNRGCRVPCGKLSGAEHKTTPNTRGLGGILGEPGAAQAVNTFSHVPGSAQAQGPAPAESEQGRSGVDPLREHACFRMLQDMAGGPVRPCDGRRSPGHTETDEAQIASAPSSPCSSGGVNVAADRPGISGGPDVAEACAAGPSRRKAVVSRSFKREARTHADVAGTGVRNASAFQHASTSGLDRASGKAQNPLSCVRAPASVEHLPPPPPRNGGPGWRQRKPAFGNFDETLAFLDLGQALAPAQPPAPSTKPAVVDRVRQGASRDPAHQSSTGYKYHAVVRKRSEREQLDGVECEHCKRFYDALESWGTFDRPPPCGHIPAGQKQGAEHPHLSRQKMCQDASRHRYRDVPPATPKGFWDMGFQDSLDSRF